MTIEAFTGDPGAGKGYMVTKKMLKLIKKGHDVYANYPLDGSIQFKYIEEIYSVRREKGGKTPYIVIDEAGLVFPAGSYKEIPFEVVSHWKQHRHKGVNIIWISQDFSDVAVALRRVTQFVSHVQKLGPLIWYKTTHPRKKTKYGGDWAIFDMELAKKYDSFAEDIGKQNFLKVGKK
jgi:zona occludens toxin (predicted ATPase)